MQNAVSGDVNQTIDQKLNLWKPLKTKMKALHLYAVLPFDKGVNFFTNIKAQLIQ
jgi:hypothetical protein